MHIKPCSEQTVPVVALMAKPARPGRVKTRLIGPLNPDQAASIHQAMMQCVLDRIWQCLHQGAGFRPMLALDQLPPDVTDPAVAARWAGVELVGEPDQWLLCDQGSGDLGQRLDHVWQRAGAGPMIFLGVDSPDLTDDHYRAAAEACHQNVAAGPVDDGGYWTLVADRHRPALLHGIDWGSERVYHQTLQRARADGVEPIELPAWYDVDNIADLIALRKRLEHATRPALVRLRSKLDQLEIGEAE